LLLPGYVTGPSAFNRVVFGICRMPANGSFNWSIKKMAPAAEAAQRTRKTSTVAFAGPNRLKLPKMRVNQHIRMKTKGEGIELSL
jgi:hypothetical protein